MIRRILGGLSVKLSLALFITSLSGWSLLAQQISDFSAYVGGLVIEQEIRGAFSPQRLATWRLGADERLRISFDLLGETPDEDLLYRIRHTKPDGTPSDILPSEAFEGWEEQEIRDVQTSRVTAIPYTHYSFTLSREQIDFKLSGRYAIEVFERSREESLFVVPLYVYEGALSASLTLGRAYQDTQERKQAVSIDLSGELLLSAREEDVHIEVRQNASRILPRVVLAKPSERMGAVWRYAHSSSAIFDGGNEYYAIEHTARRAMGQGLVSRRVSTKDGLESAQTLQSFNEGNTAYEGGRVDHNGLSLLRSTFTSDVALEGEYHIIEFVLSSPKAFDGDVLLVGDAFDYLPLERRRLVYDAEQAEYRLALPLKNGYQEYAYYLSNSSGWQSLSASYYQTSNRYDVFVYYAPLGARYDRLLLLQTLN